MGHQREQLHMTAFVEGQYDYDRIFGRDDSEEGYPALGLYLRWFEYEYLTQGNTFKSAGRAFACLFHLLTMMWVVKIYMNAFHKEKKSSRAVLLLCTMVFPATISVAGSALDSKALFFCLFSMLLFQRRENLFGTVMFSIAMGIKTEALFFLPSIWYLNAISSGMFVAWWQLLLILLLQGVYALQFLSVNPIAYLFHSYFYNLRRAHDTSESMTWAFLPQFIGYNAVFLVILTLLHGSLLKTILFARLLRWKTMFDDLDLWPLRLFPIFRYQSRKYITEVFFFLYMTGIITFKGTKPENMIWWIYSIPFLLHTIGYSFQKKGYKLMFLLVIIVDILYMLHGYNRIFRILTNIFLLWVFAEMMFFIWRERHLKHYRSHEDFEATNKIRDGEP